MLANPTSTASFDPHPPASQQPGGGRFEVCACSAGPIRWTCHPDAADLLARISPETWANPQAQRGWTCVKRNAARTVWRARLDGRLVYVKYYACRAGRDALKRLLGRSACRAEFACGRYAAEHGIAAARPLGLAIGVLVGRGRADVLVTDAIEPAEPLDEYWQRVSASLDGRRLVATRDALIESLGELIAHAHQAGFEHLDMHAANILVREDRGGLRCFFVDLHSARLDQPVADAAVVRNLAQLNQWFRRHSSIKDRVRFLRAYLRWRNEYEYTFAHGRPLGLDFRALVGALAETAERHARRLWERHDRRVLRDGRYFARLRLGHGWRAIVVSRCKRATPESRVSEIELASDWWQRQLETLLAQPCEPGADDVKQSHSATVQTALLDLDGEAPLAVIVKRPRARNWRRWLRHLLPPSRSRRGWQAGHALLHRYIAAARPLALLERRAGPFVLDSLLLTERISGAMDLATYLERGIDPRAGRRWIRDKRRLIDELARHVRQLDQAGFVHRDCKPENVLVLTRPELRLVWVDMDGVQYCRRPASEAERLRPLVRLAAALHEHPALTRTDRVRFLKTYCAGFGRDPRVWRHVWQTVAPRVADKLAQQQARRAWKLRHYGRV